MCIRDSYCDSFLSADKTDFEILRKKAPGILVHPTTVPEMRFATPAEKRDDIVAIDTGCLWGGKLTAVRFPDRRIYQEDCPCWADPFKYK